MWGIERRGLSRCPPDRLGRKLENGLVTSNQRDDGMNPSTLYLVQHGEAIAKEVDSSRPLSERGRKDVYEVAALLKRSKIQVSKVLHSGKQRAKETADILAGVLARGRLEVIAGLGPNDPVEPFLAGLTEQSDQLMVVGHLPFMARAVTTLLTGRDEAPYIITFRPASVVCLQGFEEHWTIAWMVGPDLAVSRR